MLNGHLSELLSWIKPQLNLILSPHVSLSPIYPRQLQTFHYLSANFLERKGAA